MRTTTARRSGRPDSAARRIRELSSNEARRRPAQRSRRLCDAKYLTEPHDGPRLPRMSPLPAPRELGACALDNLRYCRETMERSSTFIAVPGLGGMAMGATALLAALVSSRAETNADWLRIWLT